MDKFLYYNELFSIYKNLLTEKEIDVFSLYYEENMSMGEIAEIKNITRSAIGSTVKTVEQKLDDYENTLHIYEFRLKLQSIMENCQEEKTVIALAKLLQDERE